MKTSCRVVAAVFIFVGGVCSLSCVEQRSEVQEPDARGANEEMLEFYRTQSEWTDPGEHEAMYEGIPDDVVVEVPAIVTQRGNQP